MATTPEYGLRYPSGGENVDIATNIQNLATDVETTLSENFISTTGGAVTGPLTLLYGKAGGLRYGGSGPQVLYGVGGPYDTTNEVDLIDLPVGSIWVDTEWQFMSIGAGQRPVTWIKTATNDSEGTAWSVMSGDTGPRDLLGMGSYMFGPTLGGNMDNMNPFTAIVFRRVDNTITITFSGCNFVMNSGNWEIIFGIYGVAAYSNPDWSWGLNSSGAVYGMAVTDSTGSTKPIRLRRSGDYTYFELYAPTGTYTYSGSISYTANQSQWPSLDNWGESGYIGGSGADPDTYDFVV